MVLLRGGTYVSDVAPNGMAWASHSMPDLRGMSSARSGASFGGSGSGTARGMAYPRSPNRDTRHSQRLASRRTRTASEAGSARMAPKTAKSRPHTEKAPTRYTPGPKRGAPSHPPEQPPKRGVVYPIPHVGRDGYVGDPEFDTRSKLVEYRRLSMLPHHTFDVDGDGVVSQEDFLLANKFDDNGDGVLQDTERHHLRKKMVETTIDEYQELPNRPDKRETIDLIDAFTVNVDKTVDDVAFNQHYQKLVNSTAISRTYDSKKIYGSLQPYPNLCKPADTLHRTLPPKNQKVWDRMHTPDFSLDTHRPLTHRWNGHFTRSSLYDQRYRDTKNAAEKRLASPRDGHEMANGNTTVLNRNKRTSLAHEAKAIGHTHLGIPHFSNGLPRQNTDVILRPGHIGTGAVSGPGNIGTQGMNDSFAHAHSSNDVHGGHHHPAPEQKRPIRVQGRGTHVSLSGAGLDQSALVGEPLSFLYHGLCERNPNNGVKIK